MRRAWRRSARSRVPWSPSAGGDSCRTNLPRLGGPIRGGSAPRGAKQPLAWVAVVERIRELLQRPLLLACEVARDLDLEPVADVAPLPATTGLGWALAAEPLHRPVTRPGGDPDPLRAVERRDLDGRALDRLGDRDRHGDLQVAVAPLPVHRRGSDLGDHVEIAGRAAARAVLSLAGEANSGAVAHAGRDVHAVSLALLGETRPAARTARVLDDLSRPAALRAGLADGEQPLALPVDPAPAAARARRRRRARVGPRAAADLARGLLRDGDRHLGALDGLLERELHLGLEIPATSGLGGGLATTAVEDAREDVAEIGREATCARAAGGSTAERAAAAEPGEHTPGVVLLALLRVGQRVVGLLHLLEALLGPRVVLVAVRVVLAGELPIRLLDLVLRGLLRDSEGLVVVVVRHRRLLLAHDHLRRPQHLAVQPVTLLDRLDNEAGLGSLYGAGGEGLVPRRVEPLPGRVVGLDAGPLEGGAQLPVDEQHPVRESGAVAGFLGGGIVGIGIDPRGSERALQVVEAGDELTSE